VGGAAWDPGSGNLCFRIADARFDIPVPEPAMLLGLVAGERRLWRRSRADGRADTTPSIRPAEAPIQQEELKRAGWNDETGPVV
jgi:hypothetical protein